jgi:hypothetical protein
VDSIAARTESGHWSHFSKREILSLARLCAEVGVGTFTLAPLIWESEGEDWKSVVKCAREYVRVIGRPDKAGEFEGVVHPLAISAAYHCLHEMKNPGIPRERVFALFTGAALGLVDLLDKTPGKPLFLHPMQLEVWSEAFKVFVDDLPKRWPVSDPGLRAYLRRLQKEPATLPLSTRFAAKEFDAVDLSLAAAERVACELAIGHYYFNPEWGEHAVAETLERLPKAPKCRDFDPDLYNVQYDGVAKLIVAANKDDPESLPEGEFHARIINIIRQLWVE